MRQVAKAGITLLALCAALTLLLGSSDAGPSDEDSNFTRVGSSPPAKIAEVTAVTNQSDFAEAYAKIASTIAREAYAMDKQDWTLLAAQYTDDACFQTTTDFGELREFTRQMMSKGVCGHAAMEEYVKGSSGASDRQPGLWGQHVYTNYWLEKVEGNTAIARGYVAGLGRIEEHYVRGEDGIWRINLKKIMVNVWPPPGMQAAPAK
jgi:SnoaL-like domain